jgi:predicted dehydrogenase/glycosyltransferase involved in cell wall biosynthesis
MKLIKAVKATDFDALYLNSFFDPLFATLPALLMKFGFLRRKPIVIAPRGEFSPGALGLKSFRKRAFIRFQSLIGLYKKARWQTTSQLELEDITNVLGSTVCVSFAPNISTEALSPTGTRTAKHAGELTIVFLSRISPKKNLLTLIHAIGRLSGSITFDIWGPVDDAEYWRQCQQSLALLPGNVLATYRGDARPESVPKVFEDADVFALPTFGENYGHVIHEALSAGCPVVISDRTPWRNLAEVGVGFDVPLESIESFVQSIQTFADMDEIKYGGYAERCRNFVIRHSSRDADIEASRQMFAHALEARPINEDHLEADIFFKIKKVIRYINLYGIERTWTKIKARKHMRATADFYGQRWVNPRCKYPDAAGRSVAIIGCGNYSFSTIAYYLSRRDPWFLRATYDIQKSKALSLCRSYGGGYSVADWKDILRDTKVKIVFIASNHSSHAEYAVACIEAGKHVYIEKPPVVTQEQLDRLLVAMRQYPQSKVFLGFNRPRSPLFRQLQRVLARESGPLMINMFVAGHEIDDDHWYFDEKEGGRVLGNLCHWTDLALHLVTLEKAFPCTIIPTTTAESKSDIVVSIGFDDQSYASITFSAKGPTFEGVREAFNLHKGNVLANLTDCQSLTYDVLEKKTKQTLRHRDHGHEANIVHSMAGGLDEQVGEAVSYIEATARLFLAVQQAIASGERVVLS